MRDVRPLSADAVVVVEGQVVLMERDHGTQAGKWVLPGGYVERDETAREACVRETREEVGLDVDVVDFVGLYDDPDRDERGNVSAAYRCRAIEADPEPRAREEARQVGQFDPTDLPEMGFDHEMIIRDAVGPRYSR